MTSPASSYPDWKAPADDGQVLLWPGPTDLLRDAAENHRRLSHADTRIQNIPLPELRRRQRRWIGHAPDERLIFATGHQCELYHPGVWVKNALIHQVAEKLAADAYHFAVDTDEPKHLHLRWPGGAEPITDDPSLATAPWTALLNSPSPAHLQHIEQQLNDAARQWNFQPIAGSFIASMRRLSLESQTLPNSLTNAIHELEWDLGLRHHALLVSPLLQSEPYLVFVHHLLARAPQVAANYNAALAEYRKEHGIKSPGRPMPDLRVTPDQCEVPLWVDDLTSNTRRRATVRRAADGWTLHPLPLVFDESADGWQAAEQLANALRAARLRLSPRAITLTLFIRLLIADSFVHGIGGGRYDQVTDRFVSRFFGMDPPKFAVATATLYFPDAVGHQRVCLPCVVQQGHALRHRLLGKRKMQLVHQIESLPRYSSARRQAFQQMHTELATAATDHPALHRWRQNLRDTQLRHQHEQTLFDRELFFALQSRPRLELLVDHLHAIFK